MEYLGFYIVGTIFLSFGFLLMYLIKKDDPDLSLWPFSNGHKHKDSKGK